MKTKLLNICLLSVNILAASSEAPEGSRGAAGAAIRREPVRVTAESVEAMSCAFDVVARRRVLAKYPIDDVLEHKSKPRSNSAFSRLGALCSKDRKHYTIENQLRDGPKELGVKYFELLKEKNELEGTVEELEGEIEKLKARLRNNRRPQ